MSMDRRLNTVIKAVEKCIERRGVENVLVDSIPVETKKDSERHIKPGKHK